MDFVSCLYLVLHRENVNAYRLESKHRVLVSYNCNTTLTHRFHASFLLLVADQRGF